MVFSSTCLSFSWSSNQCHPGPIYNLIMADRTRIPWMSYHVNFTHLPNKDFTSLPSFIKHFVKYPLTLLLPLIVSYSLSLCASSVFAIFFGFCLFLVLQVYLLFSLFFVCFWSFKTKVFCQNWELTFAFCYILRA